MFRFYDGFPVDRGTSHAPTVDCSAYPLPFDSISFCVALGTVQHWDVPEVEQLQLWPAQGSPLRFWLEEG